MRGWGILFIVCLLACPGALSASEEAAFVLRPIPVVEGVRDVLERTGDPKKLRKTEQYLRAKKIGVDLERYEGDPFIAHGRQGDMLFYVFYKTLERAAGPRNWVMQRIERTEKNWPADGGEPEVKTTYQVEAFKLFGGEQKRADQHHGGYGLKGYKKREIIKTYEIGFGDVPGEREGDTWPWAENRLFEYLYRYGTDRATFDAVRFQQSRTWRLIVELDDQGGYAVRAPELGIDAPAKPTDAKAWTRPPLPKSKDIVLVRGVGPEGMQGKGWDAGFVRAAGKAIGEERFSSGVVNTVHERGLLLNRRKDGSANSIQTRAGFAGKTKQGIRLGDPRWAVLKAYGMPTSRQTKLAGAWWHYDGIGFWFDGLDRVGRIYIRLPRAK